jgi:hypothetical protein
MPKGVTIALTVVWVLLGAASVIGSMMSFFLFDAPGSEQNRLAWILFYCLLTQPVFWLIGAILPWCFQKRSWAGWLFAFPAIDVAAIIITFVLIDQLCAGQFSCK